jgi:regulator of protease activity HflC (stomatin/prohibitin superfamily)
MFWQTDEVISEGTVGLLYADGKFQRMLSPGRYRLVTLPWRKETVTRVDMRRRQLSLPGQEMLTTDGFSVRLNIVADYRVVDAPRAIHTVASYEMALYTTLQVLLRDEVQARSLDATLTDRGIIGERLKERAASEAAELGLEIVQCAVRDITLPGDVKKLLAKEAEEIRAGRAALAAAREETATLRARANTARLLAETPVLLRLRELEALTEIGQGAGNTIVLALPDSND